MTLIYTFSQDYCYNTKLPRVGSSASSTCIYTFQLVCVPQSFCTSSCCFWFINFSLPKYFLIGPVITCSFPSLVLMLTNYQVISWVSPLAHLVKSNSCCYNYIFNSLCSLSNTASFLHGLWLEYLYDGKKIILHKIDKSVRSCVANSLFGGSFSTFEWPWQKLLWSQYFGIARVTKQNTVSKHGGKARYVGTWLYSQHSGDRVRRSSVSLWTVWST